MGIDETAIHLLPEGRSLLAVKDRVKLKKIIQEMDEMFIAFTDNEDIKGVTK